MSLAVTQNYTNYTTVLPLNLRHIHHVLDYVVTTISLTANILLMIIVVKEKNSNLNAYSKALLQNCISDMLNTVVAFATEMVCNFFRKFAKKFLFFFNFKFKLRFIYLEIYLLYLYN